MQQDVLYLCAADVAGLGLTPGEVLAATAAILRAREAGLAVSRPKLAVAAGQGCTVQAMAAAGAGLAAVKWVGVAPGNAAQGMPSIHATLILTDAATGAARTIMDAAWLTGARTAACSAIGARALARADSAVIAFVGCGVQARAHLAALLPVLPGLRRARLLGRSAESVAAFARVVSAAGLAVESGTDARAALAGADVVVSAAGGGVAAFLEAGWLSPGAFLAAVDRGQPWHKAGFRAAFGVLATDDAAQSMALGEAGAMVCAGPFDAELGALVNGVHPGRRDSRERTGLVFAGMALADLGLAALIDRRARAAGVGRMLPR